MTSLERIKVLVCHHCPVLQAGLISLLAGHANFECRAGDGASPAPDGEPLPDVIVADAGRAIEWAGLLCRWASPQARPRVLAVAHSDRECDIRTAISAGVQGYLLVDDAPEHLAPTVRGIQLGGRVLSPKVASRLAESVAGEALTQREQVVLGLVIDGCCNKAIARRLDITTGTVKSHLRSAFGKLGVASRTQAVAMAHRRGLFPQHAAAGPSGPLPGASMRLTPFNDHALRGLPALAFPAT